MSTEPHTDTTPQTKRDSYRNLRESGKDVSLRRQVAAEIATEPDTTSGIVDRFEDRSANAVRPRINELVRMGCVIRTDKVKNPSGHQAYVHEITPTGRRYITGEVDPDVAPRMTELQREVVDVARAYIAGEADSSTVAEAIEEHDSAKQRRDPEWQPEHTIMTQQTDTDTDDPEELTDEQIEQIKADPVLELSDFR